MIFFKQTNKHEMTVEAREMQLNILTTVLSVLLVSLIAYFVLLFFNFQVKNTERMAYTAFSRAENLTEENELLLNRTYYEGIMLNGISIGGMTIDDARKKILSAKAHIATDMAIKIKYPAKALEWVVTNAEIPCSFDYELVLRESYKIGREGTRSERLEEIRLAKQSGISFLATYRPDYSKMQKYFEENIVKKVAQPIQEPYIASYHDSAPVGSKFVFNEGNDGVQVLLDDLKKQFVQAVENQDYRDIQVYTQTVSRKHTMQELVSIPNNVRASYTSTLLSSGSANRDFNINRCSNVMFNTIPDYSLKASARVVYPGEEISFNKITGPRTAQNGYKSAPVIEGGILVDNDGGGVCQISGTLYNAVLRAQLDVIAHQNHTIPSSYVPYGLDATLNYNSIDFAFRNNTKNPIILQYKMDKQTGRAGKLTVNIYGNPVEDGFVYDYVSVINNRTVLTPKYVFDLPVGAKEVKDAKNPPRTGYDVQVYQIKKDKNGNEVERKPYRTVKYRANAGIVHAPSILPTPIPVPTFTPAPTPVF